MSTKDREQQTPASDPVRSGKSYHTPSLQEYGSARDLTRSNAGAGADGDPNDGVADGGLDANSTAS